MGDFAYRQSIKSIGVYLNQKDRKRSLIVLAATMIGSLLDVFGLASILPLIKIISEPKIIESNYYIHTVYTFIGFNSVSSFVLCFIIAVFLFFLFKNALLVGLNWLQFSFTAQISLNIVSRQYDKYYNIDFWNYKNLGSARVLNYVANTPDQFTSQILNQLLMLATEVFVAFFIVVGVGIYQPVLFLLLAALLGPTTWLSYSSLKNRQVAIGTEIDELRAKSYGALHDAFYGYIDIKLADKREYFHNRYMKISERTKKLNILKNVYLLVPQKLMETVAIFGIVLIIVYSYFISNSQAGTLAILGLFVAAAYRLLPSVNRMLQYLMTIKQSQYTLKNLALFADQDRAVRSIQQQPIEFKNDIVFKDLGYTFPDDTKPVLEDINFTVNKGERIGFIGHTGCGKTTLMNLLLRFYKENEGQILIDGEPLKDQHTRSWWDKIGYVRQDIYILEGTIKDNVILGDTEVNEERLWHAIRSASMLDFVESQENGIDTIVGEKGNRLSGGQRQRLAIARALYRNVKILVFDEATSALDNKTEQEVTDSIQRVGAEDITLFVVAHRYTTLKGCDKIFELSNGKIVAVHDYDTLIHSIV